MWMLPETALQPEQSVTVRVWKKKYTQLLVTYGGKEWIDDAKQLRADRCGGQGVDVKLRMAEP